MTTSVSPNCKLPSHHRIFSINYLHVLMGNYIAFFYEISCLIATTFRIQINAAYFLNFRPCVRSFYLLRVGWFNEKILVQESVVLVFHRCLYNKQNITCPLVVRTSIFSCSSRCFTCSLGSLVRYRLEHSKIKYSRLLDDESQSKPLHVGRKQRHSMSRNLDSKKKIPYSLENFDCFHKTWTYGKNNLRNGKFLDSTKKNWHDRKRNSTSANNSQPLFVSRRPLTSIDWSRLQDASAKN